MSQDELKKLLEYNKDTGVFKWLVYRSRNAKPGYVAGNSHHTGYSFIKINGRMYAAHRLAWLYVYGEFPENQVDHINHDRFDNRISNLRDVTHKENALNQKTRKTNTSGVTGVSWSKQHKKWMARVMSNGKNIFLGLFDKIEDAKSKRLEANRMYGYHENHA